jgi:hypothetical protein
MVTRKQNNRGTADWLTSVYFRLVVRVKAEETSSLCFLGQTGISCFQEKLVSLEISLLKMQFNYASLSKSDSILVGVICWRLVQELSSQQGLSPIIFV